MAEGEGLARRRLAGSGMSPGSLSASKSAFAARLWARRALIEQATLIRVRAIGDGGYHPDSRYSDGLRQAIEAAIQYGIAGLETEGQLRPVPLQLLSQARLAARIGIGLDTVLRRYTAGHSVLNAFAVEEAERDSALDYSDLTWILFRQASVLEKLIAAVSDDYRRESLARPRNSEELLADRAYRLLGGEQVDVSLFRYPFEAWHLGLAIDGPAAEDQAREIASGLDCQPLIVTRVGHCTSAWLGARAPQDPDCVVRVAVNVCGTECAVGIGEAGQGLAGWRLSHRQAVAALRVCRRTGRGCARYGTAIGLAAVLQDGLAELTLRQRYLDPLERRRAGGTTMLATLRAYVAADHNVSSAAAALGINRNTVTNRIRTFEEEIGLPLASFNADLELALELHEMPPIAVDPWL